MGGNMAIKLLQEGHEVVVWSRSPKTVEEFKQKIKDQKPSHSTSSVQAIKNIDQNLKTPETVEELVQSLGKPKVVWSMLPAGEATESMLSEISKFAEKEDIVIDGSNANFNDTQRRFDDFKKKGIRFLGIGVSGGVVAAKTGYPIMVGGDKSAYDAIRPILDSLSKPSGGYQYFGEGGAGHFVKMIHNGIEYGVMQSLGEGFDVLKHAPYALDLVQVGKLWQKGTLLEGFLLDRTIEALEEDPNLEKVSGAIGISGEADWAVEQAKKQNIPIPIIEASLDYRKKSNVDETIQASFTARVVNGMRGAFGGHPVKKK